MRKGDINDKRGLAPVIASVLLILLVFVLAAFIFLWARGFITEQIEKFGQPIDALCSQVQYDVELVDGLAAEDALEVINRGDIAIHRLEIKLEKRGNSIFRKFEHSIPAGESKRGEVYLAMEDGEIPNSIEVFPALIGNLKGKDSNKVFTCLDQGKTLRTI